MSRPVLSALMLLTSATLAHAETSDEWTLTDTEGAMRLYQYRNRPMRLKLISVVEARIENFAEVLRDTQNFPRWLDKCHEASRVSSIDDSNMTLHLIMHFPLDIRRDFIMKVDTVYDLAKARGHLTLSAIKDSPVPSPAGMTRMREYTGNFLLEYLSRERTGIVYTYEADPAVNLPEAVLSLANKSIIYNTVKHLGEEVRKPKYVEGARRSKDRALFEELLANEKKVQGVLRARMAEHFRDPALIERLVEDRNIMDLLVYGDGRLAEKLFLSGKDRNTLEPVARAILLVHARKYTADKAMTERIAGNQELLTALLEGSASGRPSAADILDRTVAPLLSKQ